MPTYMSTLSHEESTFFSILNNVNCLTVWQAKRILREYLFCSPAQSSRIIQNLSNHQYITISSDSQYLTAGIRSSKYYKQLDLRVIRAMHICIDLVDSLENMKFTHIPSDNANLVFLALQSLYKVIDIRSTEAFKVNAMRQSYIDATAAQKKNNSSSKGNPFSYTTIFSVPASEDKEEIFGMFEDLDISFPAAIALFKSDELNDAPKYELYKLNNQ